MPDRRARPRLKRRRKRIPIEFEAESLKGSGQIVGVRLGSLFVEAPVGAIPRKGEEIRLQMEDLRGESLTLEGSVGSSGRRGRPGFTVHLHEIPEAYVEFYERLLSD